MRCVGDNRLATGIAASLRFKPKMEKGPPERAPSPCGLEMTRVQQRRSEQSFNGASFGWPRVVDQIRSILMGTAAEPLGSRPRIPEPRNADDSV